jgi:hypothetical protein
MIGVACAAIVFAQLAYRRHFNRQLLHGHAQFALIRANYELGDLSCFDVEARWVGNNVEVDFIAKTPGDVGKGYLVSVCTRHGEVVSIEPLPSP